MTDCILGKINQVSGTSAFGGGCYRSTGRPNLCSTSVHVRIDSTPRTDNENTGTHMKISLYSLT